MLRSRFEWVIWIVTAVLLGGGWIVASREPVINTSSLNLVEAPVVGHLAPNFTAVDTLGRSYELKAYAGQPVVLNFWATWCGPCRVEMPSFQNASRKYNGRISLLGVNQGESADLIREFAADVGVSYPLLVDEDSLVSRLYTVNNLPTTIFIDANGVVQEVIIGIISQAVLEDRIEQLLAEEG